MKIQDEYPNYMPALFFYIGDKNPVLASNDSKKLSYFICLANFKKGFTYYELDKNFDESVSFSLVTMLGFKTIVKTTSKPIFSDLNEYDWNTCIHEISMQHFMTEEYKALKKGYVKKGKGSVGCMFTLISICILAYTLI
tara:strand:- start:12920 stop:13336 length:417 start_codon:yes stop_codon:yes gene_type:complete